LPDLSGVIPARTASHRTVCHGRYLLVAAAILNLSAGSAIAGTLSFTVEGKDIPCGADNGIPAIVWFGNEPRMPLARLAAYCAPVLWFSPDEPLNARAPGSISIPQAFPFEDGAATPVVYYRVRAILARTDVRGKAYEPGVGGRDSAVIDLGNVTGIDLDFFFYYPAEAGLGGHKHDVESAEFQLAVWRRDECPSAKYNLVVAQVKGKAHGLQWYDNTLGVDEYTHFPIHLLVEEGKHATCTDKNADGYYTPNYDVNHHVNDAWGVRDVIRGGVLYTSSYESWMAKVRRPEDRVYPPLPADSPVGAGPGDDRDKSKHVVYALRPFPSADRASDDLKHFISDKGDPDWPAVVKNDGAEQFYRWLGSESFVKSLSVAFYADGDMGLSFVFPLFIVKGFEDPLGGGFITNRVIFKDEGLRDASWMLQYTPSASRWLDPYFCAGAEWDKSDVPGGGTDRATDFVFETGIKFRADVRHTPLKFLERLTDFWGVRAGIKNNGFFDIDRMRYVLEFGAGTW